MFFKIYKSRGAVLFRCVFDTSDQEQVSVVRLSLPALRENRAMKALAWHGKGDIRCDTVPDPKIEDGRDAIIKVTACAICGSDLHIFDGIIPSMQSGDVLGHETMGEVVEVGSENKALKVGDRVVVPFTISCGQCFFCTRGFYSGCERSNPNAKMAEKLAGNSPAGPVGYSH